MPTFSQANDNGLNWQADSRQTAGPKQKAICSRNKIGQSAAAIGEHDGLKDDQAAVATRRTHLGTFFVSAGFKKASQA
jgi:hypothetical protein